MFAEHISNLSIFCCNQFVSDMRSFEHINHHLKIMHFSVKKHTILHFPTNGHIRDAPVCEDYYADYFSKVVVILLKKNLIILSFTKF